MGDEGICHGEKLQPQEVEGIAYAEEGICHGAEGIGHGLEDTSHGAEGTGKRGKHLLDKEGIGHVRQLRESFVLERPRQMLVRLSVNQERVCMRIGRAPCAECNMNMLNRYAQCMRNGAYEQI